MTLDELIKDEREDAELKNACALLEAMPSIASPEELSRLLQITIDLARKAFSVHKSGKGLTKMNLQ